MPKPSYFSKLTHKDKTKIAKIGGAAAVCAVAAPYIFTSLVGFVGFGPKGIVTGSLAAKLMAAYGGKVGAGSICAMLQSIGVLGLGVVGKTSTCAVGAGLGGLGGYGIGVHTESKEDTESEKDTGFNPNYGSTGTPTSIPRVEGGSKGKGVSRRQKRDPKRPKSKRRTECPPPDESSGALDNMMRVKGISNDDVSENIRRGKAKQAETNEDSGLLGGYTEEEYDSYDSESSDDTGNNNMSSTKKIRVKIEYEHDFNPRLDEVVVVK